LPGYPLIAPLPVNPLPVNPLPVNFDEHRLDRRRSDIDADHMHGDIDRSIGLADWVSR
jgi:hypothetical protein